MMITNMNSNDNDDSGNGISGSDDHQQTTTSSSSSSSLISLKFNQNNFNQNNQNKMNNKNPPSKRIDSGIIMMTTSSSSSSSSATTTMNSSSIHDSTTISDVTLCNDDDDDDTINNNNDNTITNNNENKNSKMLCTLIEMMKLTSINEFTRKLSFMSESPLLCKEMRNCGYIPMLIRLIYQQLIDDDITIDLQQYEQQTKSQQHLIHSLNNIVHHTNNDGDNSDEIRILKILEDLNAFVVILMKKYLENQSIKNDRIDHPCNSIIDLYKMCSEQKAIELIEYFGGVFVISEVIKIDYKCHCDSKSPTTMNEECFKIRLYSLMILTHLTYNNRQVKSILGSKKSFLIVLIELLHQSNEDLIEAIAKVIQNLSWDTNYISMQTMRDVKIVTHLTNTMLNVENESTIKCLLAALGNLTASSPQNKADFCNVEGALEFLIKSMKLSTEIDLNTNDSDNNNNNKNNDKINSDNSNNNNDNNQNTNDNDSNMNKSKTLSPTTTTSLSIVEASGRLLRNVSSTIATEEKYRDILRKHNVISLLLKQLESSSLDIVSNSCIILSNLSVFSEQSSDDQLTMIKSNALAKLSKLIHSKHRTIRDGALLTYKHLINSQAYLIHSSFNNNNNNNNKINQNNNDLLRNHNPTAKLSTSLSISSFPMRKIKAIKNELTTLSSTQNQTIDAVDNHGNKSMNYYQKFTRSTSHDCIRNMNNKNVNNNNIQQQHQQQILMTKSTPTANNSNNIFNNNNNNNNSPLNNYYKFKRINSCDNNNFAANNDNNNDNVDNFISSDYDIYSGDAKCNISMNSNSTLTNINDNNNEKHNLNQSKSTSTTSKSFDTDELDYTTDFSERYKDVDVDEMNNHHRHHNHHHRHHRSSNRKTTATTTDTIGEDSVKIYETEGTPLAFSLSPSLSDLYDIDLKSICEDADNDNNRDENDKNSNQNRALKRFNKAKVLHKNLPDDNKAEMLNVTSTMRLNRNHQLKMNKSINKNEIKIDDKSIDSSSNNQCTNDGKKPLILPKPLINNNKNAISNNTNNIENDKTINDIKHNEFYNDDTAIKFETENTPAIFSHATSLSSLDVEDDNELSTPKLIKENGQSSFTLPQQQQKMKEFTNETNQNQSQQPQQQLKDKLNDTGDSTNDSDDDQILNKCIEFALPAKKKLSKSSSSTGTSTPTMINISKSKQCSSSSSSKIMKKPFDDSDIRSIDNNNKINNNNIPSSGVQSVNGVGCISDQKQQFFVEDTPIQFSQCHSSLSSLSFDSDNDFTHLNTTESINNQSSNINNNNNNNNSNRNNEIVTNNIDNNSPNNNNPNNSNNKPIIDSDMNFDISQRLHPINTRNIAGTNHNSSTINNSAPTIINKTAIPTIPIPTTVTAAPSMTTVPTTTKNTIQIGDDDDDYQLLAAVINLGIDKNVNNSSTSSISNNNSTKISQEQQQQRSLLLSSTSSTTTATPSMITHNNSNNHDNNNNRRNIMKCNNNNSVTKTTTATIHENNNQNNNNLNSKNRQTTTTTTNSLNMNTTMASQQPANSNRRIHLNNNNIKNNSNLNYSLKNDDKEDDDDDEKTYTIYTKQTPRQSADGCHSSTSTNHHHNHHMNNHSKSSPSSAAAGIRGSPRKPKRDNNNTNPNNNNNRCSPINNNNGQKSSSPIAIGKMIPIPMQRTTIQNRNSSHQQPQQLMPPSMDDNFNHHQQQQQQQQPHSENSSYEDHSVHSLLDNVKPPSLINNHSLMSRSSATSSIDSQISDIGLDNVPIRKINSHELLIAKEASNCSRKIETLINQNNKGNNLDDDDDDSSVKDSSSSLSTTDGYHHHHHHHPPHTNRHRFTHSHGENKPKLPKTTKTLPKMIKLNQQQQQQQHSINRKQTQQNETLLIQHHQQQQNNDDNDHNDQRTYNKNDLIHGNGTNNNNNNKDGYVNYESDESETDISETLPLDDYCPNDNFNMNTANNNNVDKCQQQQQQQQLDDQSPMNESINTATVVLYNKPNLDQTTMVNDNDTFPVMPSSSSALPKSMNDESYGGHQLERLEDLESETLYQPDYVDDKQLQQQQQQKLFYPFNSNEQQQQQQFIQHNTTHSLNRGHMKFMMINNGNSKKIDIEDRDMMFTNKHRKQVLQNHQRYFQNKSSSSNIMKTSSKYFDRHPIIQNMDSNLIQNNSDINDKFNQKMIDQSNDQSPSSSSLSATQKTKEKSKLLSNLKSKLFSSSSKQQESAAINTNNNGKANDKVKIKLWPRSKSHHDKLDQQQPAQQQMKHRRNSSTISETGESLRPMNDDNVNNNNNNNRSMFDRLIPTRRSLTNNHHNDDMNPTNFMPTQTNVTSNLTRSTTYDSLPIKDDLNIDHYHHNDMNNQTLDRKIHYHHSNYNISSIRMSPSLSLRDEYYRYHMMSNNNNSKSANQYHGFQYYGSLNKRNINNGNQFSKSNLIKQSKQQSNDFLKSNNSNTNTNDNFTFMTFVKTTPPRPPPKSLPLQMNHQSNQSSQRSLSPSLSMNNNNNDYDGDDNPLQIDTNNNNTTRVISKQMDTASTSTSGSANSNRKTCLVTTV